MKYLNFLSVGILFGIIMSKAEIISWYRIYEMFRFEAFHMYGIIGSAVVLGIIMVQLFKRTFTKSISGEQIEFSPKKMSIPRYLFGGIIFGLGWAMVGSCPGPMFVLLGMGFYPIIVVIIGAMGGTFLYGLFKEKLPH